MAAAELEAATLGDVADDADVLKLAAPVMERVLEPVVLELADDVWEELDVPVIEGELEPVVLELADDVWEELDVPVIEGELEPVVLELADDVWEKLELAVLVDEELLLTEVDALDEGVTDEEGDHGSGSTSLVVIVTSEVRACPVAMFQS